MAEPLFSLDELGSRPGKRHPPRKRNGVHYTPEDLAMFVARRTLSCVVRRNAVVLDPACGEGELLLAIARQASAARLPAPHLVGIDTDPDALDVAAARLADARAESVELCAGDFLSWEADCAEMASSYDVVISNPPYVRTQVLGAARAQALGKQFGLAGRVDLYHAFVAGMTSRLTEGGVLGLLCSNRFLTTKGGESLRSLLLCYYNVAEVWDLGDTKLFEAAVLPTVVVARRMAEPSSARASFVRVYEAERTTAPVNVERELLPSLEAGTVGLLDVGTRRFAIERGELAEPSAKQPWRLTSSEDARWAAAVSRHSAGRFRDLGPIRVGIKTTADSVFIRSSWDDLPDGLQPESDLVRPLLTHRVAARWRSQDSAKGRRSVLYPHEVRRGKRCAVDLAQYPRAAAYLEAHRDRLEGRDYVRKAGRAWYEIWVPQQPDGWAAPKLVWPDISEGPKFFLDTSGSIVNGDCYWLTCESLSADDVILALAVANSTFAVQYYDRYCGNRLYAGRRRFITQYVAELPLPAADGPALKELADLVGELQQPDSRGGEKISALEHKLDALVFGLFGLEETAR